MKRRIGFVSNSSSSSFLIPGSVRDKLRGVIMVRLPEEIWKAIGENFRDWKGNPVDMSGCDEWWLSGMFSGGGDTYGEMLDAGCIPYLEGGLEPYGYECGDEEYLVLKDGGEEFFVRMSDIHGVKGLPSVVVLCQAIAKVLGMKTISPQKKLVAVANLVGKYGFTSDADVLKEALDG